MTTTTPTPASTPASPRLHLDVSATPRTTFGRLVRVETRKMTDTRSGFWLLLITGLLLALTAGLVLLVLALEDGAYLSASDWGEVLTIPLSLLLPVFAILTVTSEWSQRTGLVTFSLEPHRLRVMLAKLVSVLLLALGTIVVAMVLGSIGNLVGAQIAGSEVRWNLTAGDLGGLLLVQVLYFLMAFALATLLLSTPGAIAVFYVVALLLPLMVYSILYAVFDWAQDLIPWIDMQFASSPFLGGDSVTGLDVVRLVTAAAIWIVIPMVLGLRRIVRSEPK